MLPVPRGRRLGRALSPSRVTFAADLAFCLLVLASGCQGQISGSDPGSAATSSPAGSSAGAGSGTTTSTPVNIGDVIGVDPQQLPDGVPASGRALRLSYGEYDRALKELLHLPVEESLNFPAEQATLGPYVGYGDLRVSERLFVELERSASSLAERVVGSPDAFAAVVGCEPTAPGCRDTFIDGFGLRAFRRPLTTAEQARYRAIFDRGAELVASGDAFRDGVQVTLQALLQSPKLLYRIETGDGTTDAFGARLTGFEVATRLSFMLAGTTPDAELLAAAREGALGTAEGIALQARRLVATPAFEDRALAFHERWMQLDELASLTKDTTVFPSFSPALVGSMRSEALRFVKAVTLESNGAVSALLTSRFGFVDQNLAQLYGLTGTFGTELVRVEHAPESGRLGLFTQGAFLAGHSSSSSGTSPILRGVFMLRRVACVSIPDPPPGAAMQEPATQPASELRTTRDYFTWKTSMPACTGCHSMINPTGFAFERFDGLGQWRDDDRGAPVDTTGALRLGSDDLPFNDASGLLEALSKEPQVQACYAKNWLQFAYGRREDAADSRALGLAAQRLQAGDFSVRDLAVALTERPAFNHLPGKAE
ncbi:MAG TPA: DUF1592 domain-containing protein [Polyangiaceae bacterium]|nr:DUF1592 domain-containing protein [Polyangiaceae bacterium]